MRIIFSAHWPRYRPESDHRPDNRITVMHAIVIATQCIAGGQGVATLLEAVAD